jgi:multidrug resistance protein
MSHKKSSLIILFSVIVLDLVGFGIVIPILPFYAEKLGANATVLGFLLTSYALMQFVFSPLWGKLSDKIGRRKVLLITMLGSAVGLFVLGLANSLSVLFLGRILSGIFAGNISVATAYVSDVTTVENRAKGMGLIGAGFGIGFILGPAIGGILSPYGYSVPILLASFLGIANVIYAALRLGESRPLGENKSANISRISILKISGVRQLCLINFLFTLGVNQLESIFAFFMLDRFHYDARHVAYILVMMALIMATIQGGLIKRLVMKWGENKLLIAGGLILAITFLMVPSFHIIGPLLLVLALSSLGRGISQPSLLSLVSKEASEEMRGSVMGTFQSAGSLSRVVGPIIAGILYDHSQSYPFYFAFLLLGIVFVLSIRFGKEDKTTSTIPFPEHA